LRPPNCGRCRIRVEELRQLRVGVLEVPACHVTIIAGAWVRPGTLIEDERLGNCERSEP
jgi:hypothetical protein